MDSLFASKLGTNYCAGDEESIQIETFLIGPSLRLKRLNDEIAEMQKALDKLTEKRDTLRGFVQAHVALVSSVRCVPLDILKAIFMACLPTHHNCLMSAREPPVLLGRILTVCSSWRIITLSTPGLWASLHVAVPMNRSKGGLKECEQRLEVPRTWLQRSGQHLLSISLQSPRNIPTDTPFSTPAFLRTVLSFASRWQHIRLVIPGQLSETLEQLTAGDVHMLRSLTV
ncbi:hypothetical protein DFH07DRAFT_708786, partial [Mycena maculata]